MGVSFGSGTGLPEEGGRVWSIKLMCKNRTVKKLCHYDFTDDVEFEVSSDRRTGKPIAIKLVKIKTETLPEERINGQVSGSD